MSAARLLLAVMLCGGLAACSDEPAAPPAERVVKGAVVKGAVQNATVKFFTLDVAGNPLDPANPVAVVTTDANGQFTAALPNQGVHLLAQTFDGSYLDESDPAPLAQRRRIALPASPTPGFEAVLPPNVASFAITPYSNALLKKARLQAAGLNFFNVFDAVRAQATQAFGFDPITTIPVDPVTPAAAGTLAQRQYALLLGAASQAINTIATTAGHLPDFADVMLFVDDLGSDGIFDLVSIAEEIRRFRNNNFQLYSGVALPVINETLLSQPATVPNVAPTITGQTGSLSTPEDTAITLTLGDLTVTDPDDVYPSGFTLAVLAGANYTFSGAQVTPALNFNGTLSVAVRVNDGDSNSNTFNASVTVTPVNDPPALAVNAGLTLAQGGTAALTAALGATDVDSAATDITFTVTTPPASGAIEVMGSPASAFTQADLTLGLVSYTHDGSATTADSFQFTLADAGGFSPDCPSPSPCTFAITVTPGGVAESVRPLLTGAGDLRLLDPTQPVDGVNNPLTIESALPRADFVARTLQRADITAGVATDIRAGRLVYIKDNGSTRTVWKVNLEAGQSHVPVQVSNITDACRINGLAEDIPNPDNTIIRIDTAGANGICEGGSGDDFDTAEAWLVPLTTAASSPGIQIGLGHCCGITGITNTSGALVGVLATEDDGTGSTFFLRRRNVGSLGSPIAVATLDIAGQGQTYASHPRALGDQHIYIRAFLNGDIHYKLHRVNVAAGNTLTPLFDYGTADSATFIEDFEVATHDAVDFYFTSADGATLLKVPHSATGEGGTTTLATGSPSAPIHELRPTATQLVFARSGLGGGGVFSVPKTGGTGATLGLNDGVPTFVRLAGTSGERVFIDRVAGTASPVFAAYAVDADGANLSADITDAQWAGGTFQTTCDFNLTCEDTIAFQHLYLRRQASTSDAQIERADPLTGATTGTYLGTIFNVSQGATAFVNGFGRYAEVTVFAAIEQLDLFLGDSQLVSASPPPEALVAVANQPGGGDNFWLTFGSDDAGGGGGGGTPEAFDWSLESADSGNTVQGDNDSTDPALSGNGRYVVFQSRATTLVSPSPPAGVFQIYRRDLFLGTTELVSQNFSQTPGSTDSTDPAVSHDGRFIAFRTDAPELVGSSPAPQVVLFDANDPGFFRLVSDSCGDACDFDSTQGRIAISTDGRFVAFLGSDSGFTPPAPDDSTVQAYRADMQTGDVQMVSVDADQTARCGAGGGCSSVTMSGDGRWVAWSTTHASLPNDTNGLSDVLLRDMTDGTLRLVSGFGGTPLTAASAQPFISADGRLLAFETDAALTPFDTNGGADIYVYDIGADSLARASTGPSGEQAQGIGFVVSASEDAFGDASLSGDGRYLLFSADEDTLATPVAAGSQTSPYLKELASVTGDGDYQGNIVRAYANNTAQLLDDIAFGKSLDFTGEQLAMDSGATNAVVGDVNGFGDVFVAFHPQFNPDLLRDTDGDGLPDATEQSLGTNPLLTDSDGDLVSDFDEVNRDGDPSSYGAEIDSDPLDPDTDNDDVGDGLEDQVLSDPVTVANSVLRVSQFSGNDVSCNGSAWSGTPPNCPLQSNAGVLAFLPPAGGASAVDTVFVLYEFGSYGTLNLSSATAMQFVAFIGSSGPGLHDPAYPPTTSFSGIGPVVQVSNATGVVLRNIEITGGGGTAIGAGLLVSNTNGPVDLTLKEVRVAGNTADGNGGGIALVGVSTDQLTIRNSAIENNTAQSPSQAYGGGIYVNGGALNLHDTVIAGNAAVAQPSLGVAQGGGLWAVTTTPVLADNVTVINNQATSLGPGGRGGGIYIGGGGTPIFLSNSRVSGNRMTGGSVDPSHGGGGLWAGIGDFIDVSNSVFADNFTNNGPGGGINLLEGAGNVQDSMFLANSSLRPGGGFHAHTSNAGPVAVINNLFVGNTSFDTATDGGAVEIEHTQVALNLAFNSNTIAYNQLTGNATPPTGGGVSILATQPADFSNNIVAFNDDSDTATPAAGDNAFFDFAIGGSSNNVHETAYPGNSPGLASADGDDPVFTGGFYLDQGLSSSVDNGDDGATGGAALLSSPFTTNVDGSADNAPLDIGFHHRRDSAGGLTAIKDVDGSTCLDVPQQFKFVPAFTGAPNGQAGHLIVVEVSGVTNTLSSLTTLGPRGGGSRIARDLGDGTYAITVNDDGGGGAATFSVYADGQPAPRTFDLILLTGCS